MFLKLKQFSFFIMLSFFFIGCIENEKTAYVDNQELIRGYHKMKKAKKEFEQRNKELTRELDRDAKEFQRQYEFFQKSYSKLPAKERESKANELGELQERLLEERQEKTTALQEESDEVIAEIIKEVREKVAKYGEEHNYTYIYGSNESANILYAKRGKDITIQILDAINP